MTSINVKQAQGRQFGSFVCNRKMNQLQKNIDALETKIEALENRTHNVADLMQQQYRKTYTLDKPVPDYMMGGKWRYIKEVIRSLIISSLFYPHIEIPQTMSTQYPVHIVNTSKQYTALSRNQIHILNYIVESTSLLRKHNQKFADQRKQLINKYNLLEEKQMQSNKYNDQINALSLQMDKSLFSINTLWKKVGDIQSDSTVTTIDKNHQLKILDNNINVLRMEKDSIMQLKSQLSIKRNSLNNQAQIKNSIQQYKDLLKKIEHCTQQIENNTHFINMINSTSSLTDDWTIIKSYLNVLNQKNYLTTEERKHQEILQNLIQYSVGKSESK